jgi:hypothetical protein
MKYDYQQVIKALQEAKDCVEAARNHVSTAQHDIVNALRDMTRAIDSLSDDIKMKEFKDGTDNSR